MTAGDVFRLWLRRGENPLCTHLWGPRRRRSAGALFLLYLAAAGMLYAALMRTQWGSSILYLLVSDVLLIFLPFFGFMLLWPRGMGQSRLEELALTTLTREQVAFGLAWYPVKVVLLCFLPLMAGHAVLFFLDQSFGGSAGDVRPILICFQIMIASVGLFTVAAALRLWHSAPDRPYRNLGFLALRTAFMGAILLVFNAVAIGLLVGLVNYTLGMGGGGVVVTKYSLVAIGAIATVLSWSAYRRRREGIGVPVVITLISLLGAAWALRNERAQSFYAEEWILAAVVAGGHFLVAVKEWQITLRHAPDRAFSPIDPPTYIEQDALAAEGPLDGEDEDSRQALESAREAVLSRAGLIDVAGLALTLGGIVLLCGVGGYYLFEIGRDIAVYLNYYRGAKDIVFAGDGAFRAMFGWSTFAMLSFVLPVIFTKQLMRRKAFRLGEGFVLQGAAVYALPPALMVFVFGLACYLVFGTQSRSLLLILSAWGFLLIPFPAAIAVVLSLYPKKGRRGWMAWWIVLGLGVLALALINQYYISYGEYFFYPSTPLGMFVFYMLSAYEAWLAAYGITKLLERVRREELLGGKRFELIPSPERERTERRAS